MKGWYYVSIEFNNEQIYTIYDIEHWWKEPSSKQVFEVSGAAGTGKTTLIMYFIERIGLKLDEVLFVAYMGKAANQMALNGLPAKTIHSAIYDWKKVYVRDKETGKILFKENGSPRTTKIFVKKERLDKKIKLIVLDEGSMVNKEIGQDLESFGIPIIVLGDLNQLPPVFGNPYFLQHPDRVLTKPMRQSEGNPIVWLSQQVLKGRELKLGVFGESAIIDRSNISEEMFRKSSIVLTCTNLLRYNVNKYFRENIKQYTKLDYPHVGEKVVCRKNNWSKFIDKQFYLTNGTTGFVTYFYRDSYNGKTMKIDMRPDFSKEEFKRIEFSVNHLFSVPGKGEVNDGKTFYDEKFCDIIEFAYALTVHSSQGSQYQDVLFLVEDSMTSGRNKDLRKKILYTGITRAMRKITIVI